MKQNKMKAAIALCSAIVLMLAISLVTFAEEEPSSSIGGHSLSLSTNLEIVYFANFQNVPEGAECGVVYSASPSVDYSDRKLTATGETISNNGLTYYKYILGLAAKEMSADCYARPYIKVGDTVYYGELDKYSVIQYAYNKKGDTNPGTHLISLKDMVDSVLAYGAASQQYLGYNTSRLASAEFYQITVENGVLEDGTNKGLFQANETVTLTAEVPEGQFFDHWENSAGVSSGTVNPLVISIADDASYTAVFNTGHTHTIPDTWSYNETNHFKTCSSCGEVVNSEAHTFDSNHICTVCGYEEGTTIGLAYALNTDGQSYTVTGIGSASSVTNLVVPSRYNDLPVTAIGEEAFFEKRNIVSVSLPESIDDIGIKAFQGCSNMTSVSLPETVSSIGRAAFKLCTKITSLDLPKGLTIIPDSMCESCDLLTNVDIKPGVIMIDQFAFSGCYNLKTVYIPLSVKTIKTAAFFYDQNIEKVYYSGYEEEWNQISIAEQGGTSGTNSNFTWTSIREYGDRKLEFTYDRSIPGYKVTGIGNSLETDIFIPESYSGTAVVQINSLGNTITSVHMKNNIKTIKDGAFSGCTSLSSIILPEGLTKIGAQAFGGCTSLSSITIPETVTSMGDQVFENCSGLTTAVFLNNSLTYIPKKAFINCSGLMSVTLPSGLQNVFESAFLGCTSLSSIVFPASTYWIFGWAFDGCTSLTDIYIMGPNPALYRVDAAFGTYFGTTNVQNVYYGGTQEQWEAINETYRNNFNTNGFNVTYNWTN